MPNNDNRLTTDAVENALFVGLYTDINETELEAIQKQNRRLMLDATWKRRIKNRLKKNKFVYSMWIKYNTYIANRATKPSFKSRVKRIVMRIPIIGRLFRHSKAHEDALFIEQLITGVHEKLDATIFAQARFAEQIESLNQRMDVIWGERAAFSDKIKHLNERTDVIWSENTEFSDQMKHLNERMYEIWDDHSKNSEMMKSFGAKMEIIDANQLRLSEQLRGVNEGVAELLAGVHRKLDSVGIAQNQISSQLGNCKTVVSTDKVICVQYDWNILLGVPSMDWRLAAYLSRGGHFEYGTELVFRKLIQPGMAVLDVGANVGIYSIHAMLLGAEVYAYEPTPGTYQILNQNIALNGFEFSDKVHTFNVAVSDKEGMVSFALTDNCGHNSIYAEDESNSIIEVPTVALDKELKGKRIDCFKIDVEGADYLVVQGMQELLTENPDAIGFVEFAPVNLRRAGVEPLDYYKYLIELGFTNIQVINEGTGELTSVDEYEQIADVSSVNLLIRKDTYK